MQPAGGHAEWWVEERDGPVLDLRALEPRPNLPGIDDIVDVEVDQETGHTEILRYTVVQDAGKAIHPDYVEGQFQGAAAQGIGMALNEEYIYDDEGHMENPGFLDYRIPVCSDVPMIDTVIVEVPNPNHPYGVRGVGETPIVPPMGWPGFWKRKSTSAAVAVPE